MNTRINAKDFFLHLGFIAAFYTSVVALVVLLFRVISVSYPVMRTAVYYGASSISFQVATLIVAFPLFLLLAWQLQKSYAANPELRDMWLRKWLAYITLFIAGAVVAGDLISIIYMYLDGQELTKGFLLKVLVLLVIMGGVFAYYLREIRNVISAKERNSWRIASVLIVLASIIIGFSVVGSPATQRAIRYDQQRLSDLQTIQWQVINHWQSKETLPENLNQVRDTLSGWEMPTDPVTGASYEYEKTGNLSFRICATFTQDTPYEGNMYPSRGYDTSMPVGPGGKMETWTHPAGRHCFERTIDPDFYPPRKMM